MARGPPLHLAVNNITAKTLYSPGQETALQFCCLIFLVKPKVHPEDFRILLIGVKNSDFIMP